MGAAAGHFLSNVGSVIFWALLGMILLLAADHIIDRIDPLRFDEEIKKGNIAAAIVMSALILGVAIIIYAAMLPAPNTPTG
jgi:uncharacterized membrane protein YjfL (UPF0719 family)